MVREAVHSPRSWSLLLDPPWWAGVLVAVALAGTPCARARCTAVATQDPAAPPRPPNPSPHDRKDPSRAFLPPLFEEVTAEVGITRAGQSHGVSWGHADPDEYPDVFCSNHNADPSLYVSVHGRAFVDLAPTLVVERVGDTHGASFADFDRDGDQDILELAGGDGGLGADPNHLHVNMNGLFVDLAAAYGLDYPGARGRTPVWMDWDGDSLLDVLLVNYARPDQTFPTSVLRQTGATFQSLYPQVDFSGRGHHRYAQLADLSGDGVPEVIVHGSPYPSNVFFVGDPAPVDQTANLGIQIHADVSDSAIADFNGDLLPDLYLARNHEVSGYDQTGPGSVAARITVGGFEAGLTIDATGTAMFSVNPLFSVKASDVFVGSSGWSPASLEFSLDPADVSVHGMPAHVPGVDSGVYVWRDPVADRWEVRHSWASFHNVNLEVTSELPVTGVTPVGFSIVPPPVDVLQVHQGGAFVDMTAAAGLDAPHPSEAVVAGDFDNDMDVDLYLVCTGPVSNVANLFYENQGGGTFVERPGGAGAPGSTEGRGESVATADYDLDGFLDLFVTNGAGDRPFFDGPDQLYRNRGNDHHWIELRLKGTTSNPEAIGARVLATAGGITQLREQGGGMHRWSQDHTVIHFGLGPNSSVDLLIQWPAGTVQSLAGVPADQLLTVIEP